MNFEMNSSSGDKETLKLLDFAKSVTESIKCALEKTEKPSKKKANHRKYIQRKCFTKPGAQRKANRKMNKRFITDGGSSFIPSDEGAIWGEDNFQTMLEQESDKFLMSYMQTKEDNELNGYFGNEIYSQQHEYLFSVTGMQGSLPVNQGSACEHASYSEWQGYRGAYYPPKLKHVDYEQILMNQQRQRAALSESSFQAELQDERVCYGFPQSAWQNMHHESIAADGSFLSKEIGQDIMASACSSSYHLNPR